MARGKTLRRKNKRVPEKTITLDQCFLGGELFLNTQPRWYRNCIKQSLKNGNTDYDAWESFWPLHKYVEGIHKKRCA